MSKSKKPFELHKVLNLVRPLCFFDLETTGLDVEKDKIVEITITKLSPDGTRETKTKRFNPEIPISPEATEKHGITDEMVKDELPFKKFAKGLLAFIEGCDMAGFNSNSYDAPMLYFEFLRAGIEYDYSTVNFVDVCNIFKIKEERTLEAAYKFYCKEDLVGNHGSSVDTSATIDVFEAQLQKYEDLPTSVEELNIYTNFDKKRADICSKFVYDDDGDLVFNFGQQHKGKKAHTEQSFLNWMISKATFSSDVNKIVEQLLDKK